jgi:hypothetical protein
MLQEVKCPLKPDRHGFISQTCPDCKRRFKVAFGKGSKEELAYCPYCKCPAQHWTLRQDVYMHCVARNHRKAKDKRRPCSMPHEHNLPMKRFQFSCHGDEIKYRGLVKNLYCIICGCAEPV